MKCKECGSENLIKAGTQMRRLPRGLQQRLQCKDCGFIWLVPMDTNEGNE